MPLKSAAPVGQEVGIYMWKQEIAHGVFVSQPHAFPITVGSSSTVIMLPVASTKTCVVVKVEKVLAPKCVLPHHGKTLEEIQGLQETFEVVVNLSSLKTRSQNSPTTAEPMQHPGKPILICLPDEGELEVSNSDAEVSESETDSNSEPEQCVPEISMYVQPSEDEGNSFWILIDVFHEMDKLNCILPKLHSLYDKFASAFSRTMLIPDQDDKRKVEEYLKTKNITWEQQYIAQPDWLWRQVC